MIASFLGLTLGLMSSVALSAIPGLHLAAALLLLLPLVKALLGYSGAALFVMGAAGSNLYVKRLAMIYHPQAGSMDVLGMDPALRMAQAGQGPKALALSVKAATTGLLLASLLGIPLCFSMLGNTPLHTVIGIIFKWLTFPAVAAWAMVVWHSHPLAKKALVLVGGLGFVILYHPSLMGDRHQLAPLMSGFFAIPIAISLLQTQGSIPVQLMHEHTAKGDINLQFAGGLTGAITGFMAGLGASSLASFWGCALSSDEEWVELGAASETANDVMAIYLLMALGSTRSSEAALLKNLLPPGISPAVFMTLACALFASAMLGRYAVQKWQVPYVKLMRQFPRKMAVAVVLGVALVQVLLCKAWLIALMLTVAATCLGLWLRQHHLPNQVCFAALIFPVLCHATGLDWLLSRIVFPY
ncbi:MAG: hypothetical protein RLZZ487_2323 [Pseudomonadota bacterium]|jgi:TctA family transporter